MHLGLIHGSNNFVGLRVQFKSLGDDALLWYVIVETPRIPMKALYLLHYYLYCDRTKALGLFISTN